MQMMIYYKRLYEAELEKERLAFGHNVQVFCNTYNVPGFKLAQMLDILPEYLSSMKTGKRKIPADVIEKFYYITKEYLNDKSRRQY